MRLTEILDVADHVFPTLEDVLKALPERARRSSWTVSSYAYTDGESYFWLGGGGADELDAIADSGRRVTAEAFAALAQATSQVIWGSFAGYDEREPAPWIRLHAIDSTFWRCETDDVAVQQALVSSFKDVRVVAQP